MSRDAFLQRHLINQSLEIRELKRRLLNTTREGKVVEHHPDNPRLIKVDVGPEGQEVKTPWIEYGERAGSVKTISRPAIGERMMVMSPDGELGLASRAVIGGFSDDNAHPEQAADGELVMTIGGSVFRFHAGGLQMKGNLDMEGNFHVEGDLAAEGGGFTHDGKNVGSTHKHGGVISGGDVTAPPV